MRTVTIYIIALLLTGMTAKLQAQEGYEKKIESLKELKKEITEQEKKALKQEVEDINKRLESKVITLEEAKILKENAAKKRALNIEDRLAIIDNRIALLDRNKGQVMNVVEPDSTDIGVRFGIDFSGKDGSEFIWNEKQLWRRDVKYDRRTYSDFVIAFGLNNAIIDGQSLEDSPYKIGGSRFVELGWNWRTRVFKNSNFLRLNYGFSFQFNGLKPKGNEYFEFADGETTLQEFDFDLSKSKFRMDNLVFPVHFEFGPSRVKETEERIRYYLGRKFRIGLGGYGGFNIGTRQKLKYSRDGENVKDKLKRGYNTTDFVYGLSGYIGVGGMQLYAKYDLSPIFQDATIEQRNISLGLRFDL